MLHLSRALQRSSRVLQPSSRLLHQTMGSLKMPEGASDQEISFGSYRSLKEATPLEMDKAMIQFNRVASPDLLAERALNLFKSMKGLNCGNLIDMAEHGLQTATRAHRDGADEETVVVALLHDIGEVMSPINHGEIAAGLLRPYISPQNYWTLMHHEIFQSYFYQDAARLKVRNLHERFRESPYFEGCLEFCEKYDQTAFDPDYESLPLEFFEPMVRRIFARQPYEHPDHKKDEISATKILLGAAYPEDHLKEPAAKKAKIA